MSTPFKENQQHLYRLTEILIQDENIDYSWEATGLLYTTATESPEESLFKEYFDTLRIEEEEDEPEDRDALIEDKLVFLGKHLLDDYVEILTKSPNLISGREIEVAEIKEVIDICLALKLSLYPFFDKNEYALKLWKILTDIQVYSLTSLQRKKLIKSQIG